MVEIIREPWQINAARYFINSGDKDFSFLDLKSHLAKNGYVVEDIYILDWFQSEIKTPHGHQLDRNSRYKTDLSGSSQHHYSAPLSLVTKINDYDELRFARENAQEAKKLAVIAIAVSVGAALASIFMPIIIAQNVTQTIKIDEKQLYDVYDAISNSTTTLKAVH